MYVPLSHAWVVSAQTLPERWNLGWLLAIHVLEALEQNANVDQKGKVWNGKQTEKIHHAFSQMIKGWQWQSAYQITRFIEIACALIK